MMQLDDYESLSREERLRRVCALLTKAVTLACIREQTVNDEALSLPLTASTPGVEEMAEAEKGIDLQSSDLMLFKEIHHWGEISPGDATRLWGVSRATAHRWLSRLDKAGWIMKRGATKAVRYLLTKRATALLRQMQQIKQLHEAARNGQ